MADKRSLSGSIAASLSRLSRTKTNGRLGLICDAASSVGLILLAKSRHGVSSADLCGAAVIGLVLFTFVEYGCHRWLFHGTQHALERGHWQHHVSPLGEDSLPFFLPPLGLTLLACLLALVLPAGIALSLVGGLAAGYALYGVSHLLIHHKRFRLSGPRRWAAAHHVHHHHPDKNFGVTSPLWDVILRTRYVPAHAPSRD